MADRSYGDVGGTPGGLKHFLIGFVMACVGGYLLTNQVTVASGYWNFWGTNSFGITLLPMLLGVAILSPAARSAHEERRWCAESGRLASRRPVGLLIVARNRFGSGPTCLSARPPGRQSFFGDPIALFDDLQKVNSAQKGIGESSRRLPRFGFFVSDFEMSFQTDP